MKKLLLFSLVLLIALPFSSCKNDDDGPTPGLIWDFAPIILEVKVKNKYDQNLLSSKVPDNILNDNLFLIYKNEMTPITLGWPQEYGDRNEDDTRAYLPHWFGAYIASSRSPWSADIGETLFIGEFDGQVDGEKSLQLVLDNVVFDISFTNYVKYHKDEVEVDRHFYVNGEEVAGPSFTLLL